MTIAKNNSVTMRPSIVEGNAQEMGGLLNRKFDAVITSPPYLTRLDYVRSVQAEMEFLRRYVAIDVDRLRLQMTGTVLTDKMPIVPSNQWGNEAVHILNAIRGHESKASKSYYCNFFSKYFSDLYRSIEALRTQSEVQCKWILVVQSSYYKEIYIDLAKIVSEMAINAGMASASRIDFPQRRSMIHVNTRAMGYKQEFRMLESAVVLSAA